MTRVNADEMVEEALARVLQAVLPMSEAGALDVAAEGSAFPSAGGRSGGLATPIESI
jgi:hypothetical protein